MDSDSIIFCSFVQSGHTGAFISEKCSLGPEVFRCLTYQCYVFTYSFSTDKIRNGNCACSLRKILESINKSA